MKIRLLLTLVLAVGTLLAGPAGRANAPGDTLYAPSSSAEFLSYARVIRLAHSGRANGTLLATFEHWRDDAAPTPFVIERSADDGRTWRTIANVFDGEKGPGHPWSIMWQTFLYELPRKLGHYPAGTLLLAGCVCPPRIDTSHFQLWRSEDHGKHWAYVSTFQSGGEIRPGRGIWEPFLALDKAGNLVCYFSDERQHDIHSQFLGHILSRDGGDTWGPEVPDVASAHQSDRPGMATVAKLPDGTYRMTFEVCGPAGCEVHIKSSSDGDTWGSGPADLGERPETSDGRYLAASPYLVWAPGGGPQGRLLLAAHAERLTTGGPAPESGQVIFVNTNNGHGPWSWMPTPFRPVQSPSGHANPIYSPCLLPSPDGRAVRLSVPSGGRPLGAELTGVAAAGVLPYTDPFAGGTDAGWMDYDGIWSVADGVYNDTATVVAGDKAVAGSTGWTDYTLSGDIRLTSPGQAGLLARVTDPRLGPNTLHGYAICLSSRDGTLSLDRVDGGLTSLASSSVPGGVSVNTWHHLTVRVQGQTLIATARRADGKGTAVTVRATDGKFRQGSIGLLARDAPASWRAIRVTAAPER